MSLHSVSSSGMGTSQKYLELIKRSLINDLYADLEAILHYLLLCQRQGSVPDGDVIRDIGAKRPDIVQHILTARDEGRMVLWPELDGQMYDPRNLSEHSHTMIGRRRLDSLHACLDSIIADGIPGDLIETGVWRGGATIFMRAHLAAHEVTDRTVWVADSFAGLPEPSVKEDIGYDLSRRQHPILAIDENRVRDLFQRYDLLDQQVRFLPGWFRDTLHVAPIRQLALLRLDGDLYESTMDALLALYDKVAPGGFIIVDDYGALPPCRQAVDDFRAGRGIAEPLQRIDWTGVLWRKEGQGAIVAPRSPPGEKPAFIRIHRPQPALDECLFYHSVDLAEGEIIGAWDLRSNVDAYLGQVSFAGKSVLEVGPASGYLSFHMEKAGATVTCIEPAMERLWDAFPLDGFAMSQWRETFRQHIINVRNSFWYLHHHYQSQVELIEAVPEAIPAAVGDMDIGVLASILLHTRSPLSIMESLSRRVRETMIVTELYDPTLGDRPVCSLIPRPDVAQVDTWWAFTPAFIINALACLGFPHSELTVHHQKLEGAPDLIPLFTVVARRTAK